MAVPEPLEPDTLAARYQQRLPLLAELRTTLETNARAALAGVRHIDRISFRTKSLDSFIGKCLPEGKPLRYTDPLRDVEDQVAGRVIVLFEHDLEVVQDELESYFNLVQAERKRPERASEFGYESDHLVITIAEHHKPADWDTLDDMPVTFELQIRTLFMHAWAEPQHDLGYKPGRPLTHDDQRKLAWGASSAWGADRNLEDAWRRLGDGRPCSSHPSGP